ncbi:MAG TPA: hypothetical protein VNQ14_14405, partial [Woeseiaceae bacterium]|nr:hypothetical protein [Woeseiaceae bacterium]
KWLRRHEAGKEWLAHLSQRVSELARMWGLRLGAPYEGAGVSFRDATAADVPTLTGLTLAG